jgi:hypothetical protein
MHIQTAGDNFTSFDNFDPPIFAHPTPAIDTKM